MDSVQVPISPVPMEVARVQCDHARALGVKARPSAFMIAQFALVKKTQFILISAIVLLNSRATGMRSPGTVCHMIPGDRHLDAGSVP